MPGRYNPKPDDYSLLPEWLNNKDQSSLILLCYQPAYKGNYRYFIVKRKILCYNAFKYVLNGIYFEERIS